jgi:hypothetical protein
MHMRSASFILLVFLTWLTLFCAFCMMFCLVQFYVAGICNPNGLWPEIVEPYLF